MMNEMPCPLSIARTRSGPPRACATDESHFIRPCARAQSQYGSVADSASDPPIQSNALDLVNKLPKSGNRDHAHRNARCSRACRAAVSMVHRAWRRRSRTGRSLVPPTRWAAPRSSWDQSPFVGAHARPRQARCASTRHALCSRADPQVLQGPVPKRGRRARGRTTNQRRAKQVPRCPARGERARPSRGMQLEAPTSRPSELSSTVRT
jgi:hypothetical protein